MENEQQAMKAVTSLSPKQVLEQAKENAILVDIRPEFETRYRAFDVPRVIYLPYSDYREHFDVIPRDAFIIVADSAGVQNKTVARFLMDQGYTVVACLIGGMVEWDHYGLPLLKDLDNEMVGACACRLHPQKTID